MRGLAIALVLLYHVTPVRWASTGWIGVDLFFVLSGFLITGILWDGRHRPARARRFFVKRALRILPLYYGLLILMFVVVPAMDPLHKTAYQALKSDEWWYWTYLQNWRIAFAHPNDGGSFGWFWSLAIEEQFYVVWPFVVWHASRDTIIRLCGAAIFSGLVIRVALLVLHAPGSDSILFIYVLTPCRLDGLAVGALVAMAIRGPGGRLALARRIRLPAFISLLFVAAIAIILGIQGTEPTFRSPIVETLGYPALAVAFGGLLVAALGPLRSFFSSWPLRWLGIHSYGLYLLHPFVVRAFRQGSSLTFGSWEFALAAATCSLFVAWLSYNLYERHWLALKGRLA